MNKLLMVVTIIVVAGVVGGASFWGGMSVGKAQAQDDQSAFLASRGFNANGAAPNGAPDPNAFGANGAAGANGAFGARGAGRTGQRGANGTIEKIDGNTITLTTTQGETVTVHMAADTPIAKTVLGSIADLKQGAHILVIGDRSGNNISARGIQITDRPGGTDGIFGAFGQNRTPVPAATPTP